MNKSMSKEQVIKMVPALLVLFILIAVGTYAFDKVDLLGVQNVGIVSNQETSLRLVEGNKDIVLDNTPMSDADGKAQTTYYDFTVEGTSNVVMDLKYYIYLSPKKDGNTVDSKYVKVYLTKVENNNETVVVNPSSISSLERFYGGKVVGNQTFNFTTNTKTTKTSTYRLRAWLSQDAVLQEETNPIVDKTEDGVNISGMSGGYQFNIGVTTDLVEPALKFAKENVGKGGLELVTHEIDNTLQVDNKFATEYRYRGGDSVVKNYVTFNNETWRIIGVIPTEDTNGKVENRFKIIRDTSIGNMKWNETQDTATNTYNNWVTGTLNTYLNNDYYNTLTSDAKNIIGTAKYYLGGYNDSNMTSDVMWQYERKNETNRTGYYYGTNPIMQNDVNKKIALMYASDYGYAASKECTSNLYDYDGSASCKTTNNWLDKSVNTWLLPQYSDDSGSAFYVNSSGFVVNGSGVYVSEYAVRPVLYLSSNVKISGGEGTSEQPYQLSIS